MSLLAGKYELVRPLGEGGMAEVWEAVLHGDAGFRRRVAVKRVVAARVGDERMQRLFIDEARLASRLHHANLVAVIDFGIVDGVAFQVLELVDGFDVARLCNWGFERGTPIPIVVAVGIAAQIAHALHAAHSATSEDGAPLNVVHRDVSPHNVLVSRAGDVKLADFGIARWEQRTEKTIGPTAAGKPTYMAPEQALRGAIDGRADVFSLGCTLHALLTGQSPLQDENALVDLLAGVELEPAAELPESVRALLKKALQRDRQARHASAEDFAQACEAVVRELAPPTFELRRALREWMQPFLPPAIAPTPSSAGLPREQRAGMLRPALLGGAVLVTLGGLGFVAMNLRASAPERVAEPLPIDAGAVALAASSPIEVTPEPEPLRVEAVAAPPDPAPPKPNPRPRPPPPERAVARGVLAVGGERFLKAEVIVDGRSQGFAPKQLELTSGAHQVELVLATGERVGPRSLIVTAQHTELSPLRWVE